MHAIIMTMERQASVSVIMLRMLLRYASDRGIDVEDVCTAHGIPLLHDDANARVPARAFRAIWEAAAARSKDESFGLHAAESMQYASGSHLLFLVMMNSPSVGTALESLCRYHNLMNDAVRPELVPEDDIVFLGWDSPEPGYGQDRHEAEALLCILNIAFRRLTEGACRPAEVWFRNDRPRDISEHMRIFQAPLRFGRSMNALLIDKEHLERPVNLADPELHRTLEEYALSQLHRIYAAETWSDKVVRYISKELYGRRPTIDSAARDLALSVRNLQNKLKEEGTTFQELLLHVMKETALTLLKDPAVSILDISFLLGFSEQSAFNHAFRRWTGTTPGDFRKQSASSD
jgi:AraC-like DNA-binding protein